MSTLVNFNGTGYLIPTIGDTTWGATVTNFLSDVANNVALKSGTAIVLSHVDSTPIGLSTPSTGAFTTLSASTSATVPTRAPGDNTTNAASTAFVTGLQSGYRNLIQNGRFTIGQRGLGGWLTNAAYTVDRWQINLNGDTFVIFWPPMSDAQRTTLGDESAANCLQAVFTGVNTAVNYSSLMQKVENVRVLSAKTVTLSFYAVANVALNMGVSIQQYFGTGGSPSASVNVAPATIAIGSGAFVRYSATFAMPSISGKTVGTNADSYSTLQLAFSSGSNNAAILGVGAQTGNMLIWGVQLEIGPVATPLEKTDIGYDLQKCQRFYNAIPAQYYGYATAGTTVGATVSIPPMRGVPILTITGNTSSNMASEAAGTLSTNGFVASGTVSTTGAYALLLTVTASADL